MTYTYTDYETRESFFQTDSSLYWDDIKNPNSLPYDDDVINTVDFENDLFTSWIDWCNEQYADVDEDDCDFVPDEEEWWDSVKDTFNANAYIKI